MADVKISALTAATAGHVLATSIVPVSDVTQNITVKPTLAQLRTGIWGGGINWSPLDQIKSPTVALSLGGHALALANPANNQAPNNTPASVWMTIDAPAATHSAYVQFKIAGSSGWQMGRGANDNSANFNIWDEVNSRMGLQVLSIGGCQLTTVWPAGHNQAIRISSSATTTLAASTTAYASLNIPPGTRPTSALTGWIYFDGTDFWIANGTTWLKIVHH